jgi:dihydroxy-acid dehydratase
MVDEDEQGRRKKEWEASDNDKLTVKRGVLLRYARDVAVSDRVIGQSTLTI